MKKGKRKYGGNLPGDCGAFGVKCPMGNIRSAVKIRIICDIHNIPQSNHTET
jgi:hypothetical protein